MPYLDFFTDFAVSGRIAGVGLDSRPADWLPVLGADYLEGSFSAGHLIRGCGIVEANFANDTGEWLCYMIHIKPSREVNRFAGLVPPVLGEQYGQFPARILFDEVAAAVTAAGAEVRQLPAVSRYSSENYWIPEGNVLFSVVSPAQAADFDVLQVGDVIEVSATTGVDLPADSGTRYR